MKTRTYLRVGVLFFVAIAIIFWGINYLKGRDLLSFEKHYFSRYERIGGLARSSPVTINGFQVGQVRDIQLDHQVDKPILVKFSINNKSVELPIGTQTRIYSTDLMGTKGIELIISQSEVYHQDRDTLPGGVESDLKDQVNTQILPLKMKAEELMGSMGSVLTAIGMVFDQENRENLTMSFNSITKTLNNLQGTSVYLDEFIRNESVGVTGLIKNLDSVSQSLISRANELRDFIANLTRISDTLAGAPLEESFRSLNEVLIGLHETMFTINEGSGTLGKIIYSDSLYVALLATNASLNRLIEDIRINPSRYVSLSMNDRRRTYLNLSDSDLAKALEGEGILTYYLCVDSRILESEETYKTPPELAGLNDIQIGQQLFYYSYKSEKIEGCIRRLERERKSWPNAGIYTWVGGVWTRLDL